MSPLSQLKTKLLNTIHTHYRPAVPAAAHHGAAEVVTVVDEIFGAMGSCEKCFGRGYLIAHQAGKICDCERGIRLKEFIKNYHGQ